MEESGSKYWLKWINDRVEDILLSVSKQKLKEEQSLNDLIYLFVSFF
jgi:hypothetical protein